MKKLNKVALLFATAALAVPMVASAQAPAARAAPAAPTAEQLRAANGADNWRSTDGTVWRNGTNELCWRDAFWTPATAHPFCDGALKPPPAPVPAPAPRVAPPPPPPPAAVVRPPVAPAVVPVAPPVAVNEKVTFESGANFDFDKSVVKAGDQAKLADLVDKSKAIALEVMVLTGHTDSVGADAYNQKLSIARADAVKNFLVGKGVEKNRVYTEGKGEKSPLADNKTAEGRAKNRRVSVEVFGTRAKR